MADYGEWERDSAEENRTDHERNRAESDGEIDGERPAGLAAADRDANREIYDALENE